MFDAARFATEKAVIRPALPPSFLPGLIGTDMGTMSYREQLLHPNWQRKRLELLNASEWTCAECYATDRTLHVHHKRYIKGREAWDYDDNDLIVLCEDCHASDHKSKELLDEVIAQANYLGLSTKMALGMVAGYFDADYSLDKEIAQRVRSHVGEGVFKQGRVLCAIGLASGAQLAEFIRLIHAEAEHGPVSLDPSTQNLLAELEEKGGD